MAEGAEIQKSDPEADTLTVRPSKLAGLTQTSNELLDDSSPAARELVAESLARSITLKLDLGLFFGSGTGAEIRGLANTTGIQTLAVESDLPNLDPFANALTLLEGVNATGTAIVMHPRLWGRIQTLKTAPTGSNTPLMLAAPPIDGVTRRIYGVPVYLSSQVPVTVGTGTDPDESTAFLYQADQILAVLRKTVEVEVDRSALFTSDSAYIRAIMRVGIGVPYPKAVVHLTGLLLPDVQV